MPNIFLTSDLHLGHKGVTQFLDNNGNKLRPWDNVEEMDEVLIANWNKVVRPQDKVYNLGDVTMSHKHLPILARLNGTQILIRGNHDVHKLSQYAPYFKDIRGVHQLDGFILSHIPLHPESLGRWKGNFHGHLHSNRVMRALSDSVSVYDDRYLCLCVEQINFTPISLEDAKKKFEAQQHGA